MATGEDGAVELTSYRATGAPAAPQGRPDEDPSPEVVSTVSAVPILTNTSEPPRGPQGAGQGPLAVTWCSQPRWLWGLAQPRRCLKGKLQGQHPLCSSPIAPCPGALSTPCIWCCPGCALVHPHRTPQPRRFPGDRSSNPGKWETTPLPSEIGQNLSKKDVLKRESSPCPQVGNKSCERRGAGSRLGQLLSPGMRSSQDIDPVTAGGAGITDNEFICTVFNEFLSPLLLGCYLSEAPLLPPGRSPRL